MENIKEFYLNLTKEKKIIVWVAVFFIFLSIFRVTLWSSKKKKIPTSKTFITQMKSENKKEKMVGIYGVGKMEIKEALTSLKEIFENDPDPQIKRVSAWSVGKINIDELVKYLDSDNKLIRDITIETLLKLDRKNLVYIINRFDKFNTDEKVKILSYLTEKKYESKLMDIAEDTEEEKEVRKKALENLKKIGTHQIESRLWNLYYNDEDKEIREISYQVIQEMRKRGKE